MKYSLILILLLIVLVTPIMISATEIGDTTINVKVFNTTRITDDKVTMKIEIINEAYTPNNDTFTINFNSSNEITSGDSDFKVLLIKTEETDQTLSDKYTSCMVEKGQFEWEWTKCLVKLGTYEGENTTKCSDDLATCNINLKEKDSSISTKDSKITELEDEKSSTKNSLWFYIIIAFGAGIVGCLLYQGKIGKGTAREKSMGEYNKQQAG